MAKFNAVGIAAAGFGGLLLYSAVQGKGFSNALRAILSGQSPGSAPNANPILDTAGSTAPGLNDTPAPNSNALPSSQSGNRSIVQGVAAQYGWSSGQEWTDLNNVIMQESGYNNTAQNPTSTAYGIFQFLDTTWAGVGAQKTSNPLAQSIAGLAYIKERYGDPQAAWAHEQQYGWY